MNEEVEKARHEANEKADEGYQLKLREKDEQIEAIKKQLEDAKRKAEQGSQQLQIMSHRVV